MEAELVDAAAATSKNGHPQAVLTFAPVDADRGVQKSLSLRMYVRAHTDDDSPAALGEIREKAYRVFSAVLPNFPKYTKKSENPNYTQANAAVDDFIFATLADIREGRDSALIAALGEKVYMKPGKTTVNEYGTTQWIDAVTSKLPEGKTALTTDFVDNEELAKIVSAAA